MRKYSTNEEQTMYCQFYETIKNNNGSTHALMHVITFVGGILRPDNLSATLRLAADAIDDYKADKQAPPKNPFAKNVEEDYNPEEDYDEHEEDFLDNEGITHYL